MSTESNNIHVLVCWQGETSGGISEYWRLVSRVRFRSNILSQPIPRRVLSCTGMNRFHFVT